ncbi:MAG: hypothetical protein SWK76_12495 [Actinomycetota bacterium]|nr:hypothetical protein [Actinomycetota bacterium]
MLCHHPAISEVAVVSAPDERWGETVAAVIVPREGEEVTGDEAISFCKERLAGYKCPRIMDSRIPCPRRPS